MFTHPNRGLAREDWQSGRSGSDHDSHFPEKQTQAQDSETSKQSIWRLFRLGVSLALTIAALVLTLIILVVGRHGDGGSDLALITVNMTNFVRFEPPTIELVSNSSSATKTRRGIGSWESDVASAAGSVVTSVETAVSGAASAVETAAAAAATAAEAEADKIVADIGDTLEDIETAVTGLMDKVLDTIQDELNKWLQETASALYDVDVPDKMSLHLTTFCSTQSRSTSNSTKASCGQLFSRGGAGSSNATSNNGTILGFQPGGFLAKALGVFYVPTSAQDEIREPVDTAADTVERLLQEAGNDLTSWSVDLLFIPIVAVYILAAVMTCLLVLILIAATAFSVRSREGLPARVYSLCGSIAALAAFFLLLGSVILTVIALVAYIVGLGGSVVGITITSGYKLKWMSWAAFAILAFVAVLFKVEEFAADCMFWWRFIRQLLGLRKSKGGARDMMRSLK